MSLQKQAVVCLLILNEQKFQMIFFTIHEGYDLVVDQILLSRIKGWGWEGSLSTNKNENKKQEGPCMWLGSKRLRKTVEKQARK